MVRVPAIDLKLLRDLRRLWAQALAIAVVLACGVMVLLISVGMSGALDRSRTAYYERNAFADVFARATRAPRGLLPEIAAIPGVRVAEARISRFVMLDLPGRVQAATGQIVSLPETGRARLNRPLLTSGRWPDPGAVSEVVVNAPFAEARGFRPGDLFHATLGGKRRTLTVVGTALSPEFIYTIGPGSLMPDHAGHGIIWIPARMAEGAFDMTGAFDDLVIALHRGASEASVIDAVDALLDPYGGTGAHGRADQISHAFLDSEIEGLRVMAWILPPVFLVISIFLVNMVVGRIVALERAEIGLLKALGYSDRAILVHYLLLAGLVALIGVLLGFALGAWLSRVLARMYAQFYDFPELIFGISWTTYALAALAGFGASALGAVRAALSAAWLPPAVAMVPAPPPVFTRGRGDRLLAWLRLPQTDLMILRSLTRWPIRALTTLTGYALGTAILVASGFMPDSMDALMERTFDLAYRQDVILTFGQDAPASAVDSVRRLPGVMQAEGQLWLSATLRNGHRSEDVTLQGLPPGSDLSRLLDDSGAVEPPPIGIMLTDSLLPRLGLSRGAAVEVTLTGRLAHPVKLTVTGTVPQTLGPMAYMSAPAVEALLGRAPRVSSINVTLREDRVDAFHAAVKQAPGLGGAILLSDNRRAFEDTMAANVTVMSLVYILLGGAIAVGVAYNGARIQLSERARELASLRILGFGRWEVSWVLVGEAMVLAVCAQPLGWAIGYGIAWAMTERFSSDLFTLPLVFNPRAFALASIVTLVSALGAVLIVRRRTDRLDLVQVMKTRE
ncbi:ABC transporter permease [Sagittula sp. M10.9X]|uniref:ABC transporter permease n=2 Tax=Sagittula salina TaxID=2820268 RepID=A0A940S4Z5_9RHOB|nr:ABC transporter permease [Sagittula salina]